MKKTILSTSNDLYLVEFHSVGNGFIFNGSEPEILGNLIQQHGRSGILKISRYNAFKMKFEKQSIKTVSMLFSWDTHSIEQLKRVNFIKQ